VSLCDIKAFAHTGILPMGGMYYNPQLKKCVYQFDKKNSIISCDIDFADTPLFEMHQKLAQQVMEQRLIPLLDTVKGEVNLEREIERIRCGMAGCALLTINIAKLLEKSDGRGVGLLPLAIMLFELRGLPSIQELNNRLTSL
jgi:hypothetical protein